MIAPADIHPAINEQDARSLSDHQTWQPIAPSACNARRFFFGSRVACNDSRSAFVFPVPFHSTRVSKGDVMSKIREDEMFTARGSVWRALTDSDDESETVWAFRCQDPDRDGIIRYEEIEELSNR